MKDVSAVGELFASLENGLPTLSDASDLALQIQDQNARYVEAAEVFKDESEVLELVQFGIAEEQEEAWANMLAVAPESNRVFETLGVLSLSIPKVIDTANTQLEELNESIDEREHSLEEQRAAKTQLAQEKHTTLLAEVERLAPRAVSSVKELLEARDTPLTGDEEIGALEDEILTLMGQEEEMQIELKTIGMQSEAIEEVIGRTALTYELPIALLDQDRSMFAVIDELPVEPELNDQQRENAREFTERHVDQPEAALYAALCLLDSSGKTVSVDQIVHALYSSEVITTHSDHHMRARVTTTLGPQLKGENIRAILKDEAHILQYGWRRILTQKPDGQTIITRRERIYRAVDEAQLDDLQEGIFEGDGYTDTFEMTPEITALVRPQTEETDIWVPESAEVSFEGPSDQEAPLDTIYVEKDCPDETNSQRKERLKQELEQAIIGPARSIIKELEDHGALEEGGIKLNHLKFIFTDVKITDGDIRHIIGSRITPNDDYWFRSNDAVKLVLSVSLEDPVTRAGVASRQWRSVVNKKIEELVGKELRGIERRRQALQSKAL